MGSRPARRDRILAYTCPILLCAVGVSLLLPLSLTTRPARGISRSTLAVPPRLRLAGSFAAFGCDMPATMRGERGVGFASA